MFLQVIITDLGEIGENAIIVFEENVGVGAEEIVANQEYVAYSGDSDTDVMQVTRDQAHVFNSALSRGSINTAAHPFVETINVLTVHLIQLMINKVWIIPMGQDSTGNPGPILFCLGASIEWTFSSLTI